MNRAGGEILLDHRVRRAGSHHQKFVVLRHPGRPGLEVALAGGIDLCRGAATTPTISATPRWCR